MSFAQNGTRPHRITSGFSAARPGVVATTAGLRSAPHSNWLGCSGSVARAGSKDELISLTSEERCATHMPAKWHAFPMSAMLRVSLTHSHDAGRRLSFPEHRGEHEMTTADGVTSVLQGRIAGARWPDVSAIRSLSRIAARGRQA
jgi:hypothetical protein